MMKIYIYFMENSTTDEMELREKKFSGFDSYKTLVITANPCL
jgi:hypothetical protein